MAELGWRFSRSSGPGGQNVNSTDTRVELIFYLATSVALPAVLKARALERLAPRLVDGALVIVASEHRSQWQNRVAACPASSPLADWRQSSWPVRGTDRPPVVAGDNRGAMTLEATRKLSHPSVRAIASTDFL